MLNGILNIARIRIFVWIRSTKITCNHHQGMTTVAPGRGGKGGGGGRPSNVFQDHFSNSSNSGVKIAGGGGGGNANDLGNYNVYEHRFLQSCHFNCIFQRSVQY